MSFSDELNSIANENKTCRECNGHSKYDSQKMLQDVLKKCEYAALGGKSKYEGYFYFKTADSRDFYYEFLKKELKKPEYGFTNFKIKKHDSVLEDDYIQIHIYISWLKKPITQNTHSNTPQRAAVTHESLVNNLENEFEKMEAAKVYKEQRKKQFKEIHPHAGAIKTILIIVAFLFLLFSCN
ncbi:MAG: hypothetical protein J6L99_01665 [Ruminococcus sp.]|nr:hypothetical protein [Ruminococcus sp.]